tara:strand:- start:223 stop:612 length:390 start_codon:yes stop_codon:yes gene_type:complete
MEIIMKKEKHSDDRISEQTLHEILLDIKYRLDHIEDITADDRTTLIKLVKQTNQIVKFLSSIDVEPYEDEYDTMTFPSIKDDKSIDSDKLNSIKELVDEYMTKHKNLKELEKELKKYKDDITPGQIGEA